MRAYVLFALLATAVSANPSDSDYKNDYKNSDYKYEYDGQNLWQSGQVYEYEMEARTMSALGDREWQGVEMRARFALAAHADGRLLARLYDARQARLQRLPQWDAPAADEPEYRPVSDLQQPFEIRTDGGRVLAVRVPAELSPAYENLFKGLVSTLQVDLSDKHLIKSGQNYYNERAASGSFRKMEADVTGRCEVLYAVAPLDEETFAVDKSNDYRNCDERALYNFGAYPRAWNYRGEEDLVHQSTVAKYYISRRNGTVQYARATSKVAIAPLAHGDRDGNVVSEVRLQLVAAFPDEKHEQFPADFRDAGSLLYTLARRNEQPERAIPDRFRRSADYRPRDNVISQNHKSRQSSSESESGDVDEAAEYHAASIESSIADSFVGAYIYDDEKSFSRVKETIRSIAGDLRTPDEMPRADTLAKYYIVERTLESMSEEQMAAISKEFEAKRSDDEEAQIAWTVYRDSVVQAGTPAAFRQIKSWIYSKKLRGEEAAQVVSTLASTLRYPTEKIMAEFFELAVHADVRKERQLHASALLAATRFINAGHVDNSSAHYRYPAHVYGRLAHKRYPIVSNKIVPYFKRELKAAMQKGATDMAQLYVKAIGNIGHEDILEIFAPYLEGKLPSTTFMRAHIVRNMHRLARQEPHTARAVLYRIYKNRAEDYEVRVAAVHTLMKAHPTSAMLQEMAADTHSDDHVQVRAFIKYAIQNAAQLDSKAFEKLAKAARAAQNFVTEEDFGHQYSAKYYNDYESDYYDEYESDDLGHFQAYGQTGSEDSLFPKQFSYTLKNKVGQWQKSFKLAGAISSWSHFFDIIQSNKMSRILGQPKSLKWSAENIAKALNIQGSEGEPFSANILIQAFQQQRFFAFNEDFIKSIEQYLVNKYNELANGVNYKYTKMYNSEQFEIMFPLVMGLPFVFKYRVPTVVNVHSFVKSNGKWMASSKFGLAGKLEAVFARNYDGEYGFFNTIDNKVFSNGISNKFQIYIPVEYKFEINTKTGKVEVEFAPLNPDVDANIMHYSYWPYAAYQKLGSQTPVSQDPDTYMYRNENYLYNYEKEYGKYYTGMAFHLKAYSESPDFYHMLNYGKPFDRKISAYICHIFAQKHIAVTNMNLKYYARESSSKKFVATYAYDNNNRQQAEGNEYAEAKENLKEYVPTEYTPDNKNRQNEMLERVASDIKYAKAVIHDFGFYFYGPEKYEYTVTYAHASSPVDKRAQMIFFYNMNAASNQYQILATAQFENPNRPMIDFQKVLNHKANADMYFHLRFGPKVQSGGQVEIRSKFESTDEYRKALSQSHEYRRYLERQDQNALDFENLIHMYKPSYYNLMTGEVFYKNIDRLTRFYTHQAYNIFRHYFYHYYQEQYPEEEVKDGQINFRFHLSNYFDRLNISIDAREYNARFENLPVERIFRQTILIKPSLPKFTDFGDVFTRGQYYPMCAVDQQYVETYDNYRYEYEPEYDVWYVLTQFGAIPNQHKHNTPAEQAVVLVRHNQKNQKELQIYYRSPQGEQPVTVELLPSENNENAAGQFIMNGQQQDISQNKVVQLWSEVEDAPLVQAYALPEGAIVVNIANDQLRIVYNGKVFYLYASGDYRNATSGLCGTMSGDSKDDFRVPDGGYVEEPRVFAAYYVVPDSQNPKSIELQQFAQTVPSIHPQRFFTAIYPYHDALYPNRYPRRHNDDSSDSSSFSSSHSEETYEDNEHYNYQQNDNGVMPRSYAVQRGPCKLEHQVQYYEKNGQICITYQPVAACSQRCRGEKHQAYPAKVSCKSAKDQKYRMYKEQIRRGQNPQLDESHNQPTGEAIFNAPTVCKA